jgi:hypothetical protein
MATGTFFIITKSLFLLWVVDVSAIFPHYSDNSLDMVSSVMGEKCPVPGGSAAPWHRSQVTRVASAAPNNRFMATVTVFLFSGFSKNELEPTH